MKIPTKTKQKKERIKKKPLKAPKTNKEQIRVVADEIKFARLLSGNEKKTRDKVLRALKKWLVRCFESGSEFKETDFVRIWKGLFYAVWMSDKPLVQEELCEAISNLLDHFPTEQVDNALLMVKAGFKVLATEWYGIDHHRMDKFLMLARRYLRGSFRCLKRSQWSLEVCQKFANVLADEDGILAVQIPQYARNSVSLLLHILDCYLEELAKVSGGEVPGAPLAALLRPACALASGAGPAAGRARRLLGALLAQSEPSLLYMEKTKAWEQMGCPAGGPDALEREEESDQDSASERESDMEDQESPRALDPRAGRVDVLLPLLPVPAQLLHVMRDMLPAAAAGKHKWIKLCIQRLERVQAGAPPFPAPRDPRVTTAVPKVKPRASAAALRALEDACRKDKDVLKLRGLKRKHRKRLLKKARAGHSIVEELEALQREKKVKPKTKPQTNGWTVEPVEPVSEEPKEDKSSNVKNNNKNKKITKETKEPPVKAREAKRKPEVVTNIVAKKLKADNVKTAKTPIKNSPTVIKVKESISEKPEETISEKPKANNIPETKVVTTVEKQKTEKKNTVNQANIKNKLEKTPKKDDKASIATVNKTKNYQKPVTETEQSLKDCHTPKKVKFILKNNCMQGPIDYYKSVRLSPNIPFDSSKIPSKTNLKPWTPSPINPFFKKKMKLKC